MLSRRRAWSPLGALLVLMIALAVPVGSASADGGGGGGVTCPDFVPDCDIHVGGGGGGGNGGTGGGGGDPGSGGGGGGGSAKCVIHWKKPNGQEYGEVPCYEAGVGWFNFQDECYWDVLNPQPAANAEEWQWGNGAPADAADRAKGKAYNVICPGIGRELAGGTIWSLNPPPGFGGGPSPEELAREAIKKMRLLGPQIGTAPGAGKTGIVGMPVWIWNVKTDRTWGPVSASASAAGLTVTATANVKKIVYSMGDGGGVTCTSAGTPYKESYGGNTSPDCGYRYTKTSGGKSGNAFSVSAVTTWTVHWAGGGQQGDITTTRASGGVQLAIGEAQVVAKP
ncbi:hypothetical protein [Streptomyces sp. RKAG337]|uniref:hypothetical protein n=1 Tax=Streptomyces sp. RKAG337 TaxID=2893404 RepID=UPI0020346670|nr:hypothetical protein [Streptomyces sp. RKAG337]MCM2430963.1 hypothetical protein [Streptomyces sp. RKAG337]